MDPKEIKPGWKDFLALVTAAYQLLLVPVLVIIVVAAAIVYGLGLLLR